MQNETDSASPCGPKFGHTSSYWSIGVFLVGLTLYRFGLWITDLCITQEMQEEIPERQRGVVNGVQHSINQLMDMLKNVMVILLPASETFGLLVILSMCAYVCAFFFYAYYFRVVTRTPVEIEMQTIHNNKNGDAENEKSKSLIANGDQIDETVQA